ncbi:RNA polymerase sigma-70 factor (ECF subfamily) [Chitinophaga niastensis]|uniref:RNA polymerase sigma-70 factor (ECF subfamily) n=1 Tax=Chitinophaga niastensis TaxID=536980 RepID=A0A2P8HP12_CHINA|nr:sigma-70 family RNA polymerase sigma factor [Chitinophaga niastensis]PSL47953.1 RNA polymerase sigma-70 factor (ECF subfamily) [Chitinophaga niastensis]
MRDDSSNYSLYEDDDLVKAFQLNADIRAFEEIYKRFWFKLYNAALKRTTSRQEAEELIQTIFERLWANRQKAVINNVGAYLAVSLRNILNDFQRRKITAEKFRQSLHTPPVSNSTEEDVNRDLLLKAIDSTLKELPEKTRTVFLLSRFENKSVREIAGNLDLTEKAVEYHITKAIKLLRQRLKGYLPFFF